MTGDWLSLNCHHTETMITSMQGSINRPEIEGWWTACQ